MPDIASLIARIEKLDGADSIWRRFDLRPHGGPRPTWRPTPDSFKRADGSPLRTAMRRLTNRQAKRAYFTGDLGTY